MTTASSVTQYGITWTFDASYTVGQFVTGDWWVVGPVTVTSVSPAPTTGPLSGETVPWQSAGSIVSDNSMRNGSMIVMTPGVHHGYDSRSNVYSSGSTVSYPLSLAVNRSLISTKSQVVTTNKRIFDAIMFSGEDTTNTVLSDAAVLTCLSTAPPAGSFRPCYAGGTKTLYNTSALRWDLLLNLSINPGDYANLGTGNGTYPNTSFAQYARYFQRPWLDHMNGLWQQESLWPTNNQPAYGREFGRIVSTTSMLLHTNATNATKQDLLYGFIQYGIDLAGLAALGGGWLADGGHAGSRKWPIYFASLMLDAPSMRPGQPSISDVPQTIFSEDQQTYYAMGSGWNPAPSGRPARQAPSGATGWYGQSALYSMVFHGSRAPRFQEVLPTSWTTSDASNLANDQEGETYRESNMRTWVGYALACLLMGQKALWNHNAFFDNVEDWMRATDIYAAGRTVGGYNDGYGNAVSAGQRPVLEKQAFYLYAGADYDAFVTACWTAFRSSVPTQANGTSNLAWDINATTPGTQLVHPDQFPSGPTGWWVENGSSGGGAGSGTLTATATISGAGVPTTHKLLALSDGIHLV